MGFDSRGEKTVPQSCWVFQLQCCLPAVTELDFTAVLPEIVRVIGNWGMAVRCWGTKRRQYDIGDYQPSSLSLQIGDKGFASRKEARTLERFCQTLSDKHKHTEKNSDTHQHICCLAAHLPTGVNVSFRVHSHSIHKTFSTKIFRYCQKCLFIRYIK